MFVCVAKDTIARTNKKIMQSPKNAFFFIVLRTNTPTFQASPAASIIKAQLVRINTLDRRSMKIRLIRNRSKNEE